MRTTIKIMRRKRGQAEYMAYCLRCSKFVSAERGEAPAVGSWVTKASAVRHALKHLAWHKKEDLSPLPERWYWKLDWPIISEVSDEDEKELTG
jgi:hypothetical protein